MAQDQRAERQQIVDVAIAVDVDQIRPLAAGGEERIRLPTGVRGASGGLDAAGQDRASALEPRARPRTARANAPCVTRKPAQIPAYRWRPCCSYLNQTLNPPFSGAWTHHS